MVVMRVRHGAFYRCLGLGLDIDRKGYEGSGGLGSEELAEVRDGEGDQAAFGAVDEAFLDEAVAGR